MNLYTDYDLAALKMPPHSPEAELAVIGAILINPAAFEACAEHITAADFYGATGKAVFSAAEQLYDLGAGVDIITICDRLAATGELDAAGGFSHIAGIASSTPSTSGASSYAKLIRDRARLRRMIIAANKIADKGYDTQGAGVDDLINDAQAEIMALSSDVADVDLSIVPRLKNLVDEWQRRSEHDGIAGLSTGYKNLDDRTHGLGAGDLIILAARPAMGKTTLAMNIVEHCVTVGNKPALVISMEMTAEQLLDRSAASVGRIPYDLIRTGKVFDNATHGSSVTPAISMLKNAKLMIDDRPALNLAQIRASARRASKAEPLALIVVDYLQLAHAKAESRVHEVTAISQGLKALAKEFKCPVIALSQLSRKCEERADRRPMCSDLRDSGAIEQDADIILFLYRDEIYNEDTPWRGVTELICAKQRNGTTGTDFLASNLHMCRFDILPKEWQPPMAQQQPRKQRGFQ